MSQSVDEIKTLLEAIHKAAVVLNSRAKVLSANRKAEGELHVRSGVTLEIISPVSWSEILEKKGKMLPIKVRVEDEVREMVGQGLGEGRFLLLAERNGSKCQGVQEEQESSWAESQGEFLGMVVHDLKTPLHKFILTLDVLREVNTPGETEQFRNVLQRTAHSMLFLVEDLLSLTKLQSGKLTLDYSEANVQGLVKDVLEYMAVMASHRHVALEFSCVNDPGNQAIDVERMRQVLINVVSNAIKYSPEGAKVETTLGQENGKVRISVRDEGPGIPLEEQERLFHAFEQLSSKKSASSGGGTGLGLYISRKLVELHGGTIRIDSVPGQGAEFVVELPLGE